METKELLIKVIEKIFNDLKEDYPTPNEFDNLGTQEQLRVYEKTWNNIMNIHDLCFKAKQTVQLIEKVEQ